MWQVEEKGLDAFLVEVFPIAAIAAFLEPVSVEDLLELAAHGNGEIRFREMQRLGHERESGVRYDRARTDQVLKESFDGGLLKRDIALDTFTAETTSDERNSNGCEQLGEWGCRGSYVHEHVIAIAGSSFENLLAEERRKKKRVPVADRCTEERDHEIGIGVGRHQLCDKLRRGRI